MRDQSFAVIRAVGVETGGSNIQFGVNPDTGRMVIIEMNPRVSRSSALASKATGFPIAKIAAKLAVGYLLDEIRNDITRETPASFEPTIDYVVTKIPRFAFEKFPQADPTLTTQMKSVGEAMAIGRTFKESLQKCLRSLEIGRSGLGGDGKPWRIGGDLYGDRDVLPKDLITRKLTLPNAERIFFIRHALRAGFSVSDIFQLTKIDRWFLTQIQELVEAVVLPVTHKDRFKALGIKPPKGVLLYGPPGTGKTLIARACAAQTNATFLKLAGPQLVQMFIGDGAKLVRDAFALAKEKAPAIIFIDEIDAVGTKRFDSELSGDREVQRTMLELLNQLDGFSSDDSVKVIAATNRADILDPALLRSGRLDRKIEFPHPTEDARAKILAIHARRMNVGGDVNYDELARGTDDFNAAQLKAVCVEAGMLALRRGATEVCHEDFNEGVVAVQAKKKALLNYYA